MRSDPLPSPGGDSAAGRERRRRFGVMVILAALAAGVFLFGGNGLWRSLTLARRIRDLEARVDSLARVNEQMKQRLQKLTEGDLRTLEEEARSHGLVKPGERVYLLRSESDKK